MLQPPFKILSNNELSEFLENKSYLTANASPESHFSHNPSYNYSYNIEFIDLHYPVLLLPYLRSPILKKLSSKLNDDQKGKISIQKISLNFYSSRNHRSHYFCWQPTLFTSKEKFIKCLDRFLIQSQNYKVIERIEIEIFFNH
ncbi:MAG: hypothetical protein KDD50_01335 [Bdellovibrionales bacterium]|nr:hypothetical protein [Bdellovibrionales bacterium]